MNLTILPLAITMMAGPQILSSIIFVTTKNPIRTSLAYLSGILLALISGVTVWYVVFSTFLSEASIQTSDESSGLKPIQLVLVGLLIYLAINSYLQRATAEPPKWLQNLSSMRPLKAVALGFLLIFLFPSDFVILVTVGSTLAQAGQNILDAIPFMALTLLLAALPLITYLLFQKKMVQIMPKVRDWMDSYSWAINIFVYVLFIFLIV